MEWTNVKDGLPDELKLCLVVDRNCIYDLDRNFGDGGFEEFYVWWMPVPQVPEEE
jgi:hypothetical protein